MHKRPSFTSDEPNEMGPGESAAALAERPSPGRAAHAGSDWPPDGGEMGALMRQLDWSATPLGPPAGWPQSLRTAVRIILGSRYAMFIWWGRSQINLYNDAYRPILGKKHPGALGRPAPEIWAEIWDQLGPRAEAVIARGEGTFDERLLLMMERHGYQEETYFTFSYSPLPDDRGGIGGMFCAVTEETDRVLGERRLTLLGELAARTGDARSDREACAAAAGCIALEPRDIPFAVLYLVDADGARARQVAAAGIAPDHAALPPEVPLNPAPPAAGAADLWGVRAAIRSGAPAAVEGLPRLHPGLPTGPWGRPPDRALAVPIARPGQATPAGVLVAALNPYRPLDEALRGFVSLIAGQIGAAIASARALEEERRRAEALAELDRAKTTFFSNISHELRTPLTLMLGPLEDLLADGGDALAPEAREQLALCQRNALRLLKLVNALLEFSRIEAGRAQAAFEPTDLAAFTAELASVFRSAVERAGLRLVVDCPPLPQPAHVDRGMWEKIVFNLLSNALKFTLRGAIEVRLRAAGGFAELQVRDTGVGIPAPELPRLFERFHRVEGVRGRSQEGTGIGLALVQELARLHGGTAAAESAPGQGSAFTVRIPLGSAHLREHQISAARSTSSAALNAAPFLEEALRWTPARALSSASASASAPASASASASASAPASASASAPAPAPAARPRILLADDNADMRDYVARLLRPQYEVEAVDDGEAALAAARRRPPDLVLSDVMMPGLDGFALLRALRGEQATAMTPVILLSARAGEESRVHGLDTGADDYLVKPFSARELLARVESHLRLARLRREADQALRESEQRFRATFEQLAVGIALCSPDGRFIEVNPGMCRIVGYTADELRRMTFADLTLPEDLELDMGQVRRVVAGEIDGYTLEKRYRRKDGAPVWVELTASAIRDASGALLYGIGLLKDITERKRVDEERTAILDSERAARAEAERANKLKDDFLAVMSHELRTPLNAILGWTQMLRRGTLPPASAQKAMEVIERNTLVQVQLISDLLDVSRITSGKLKLETGRADLGLTVESALDAVKQAAAQKGVGLERDLPHAPVWVNGDAARLQQVVWNLLSNAVKFSPAGGHVWASLVRREGRAVIRVRDEGQGIRPEFLPHLFERFSQADSSAARQHGGLGLGLSIVKHLVDLHGGSVRAESEGEGRGATFIVELPLADAVDDASRPSPGSIPPGALLGDLPELPGLKVMVVDDEPDARELLRRVLTEVGAAVRAAGSAAEALEQIQRERPDVLVSDLGMPGEDGFHLIRAVRGLGGEPRLPAIAVTAFARAEDRTRALAAGFDAHVPKPLDLRELLAVLVQVSGRAQKG